MFEELSANGDRRLVMRISIVDAVAVIFIRVRAETRYLNCRCIDEEHISSF
jgi:hypothetical protein